MRAPPQCPSAALRSEIIFLKIGILDTLRLRSSRRSRTAGERIDLMSREM
jgi:hypothetical protein